MPVCKVLRGPWRYVLRLDYVTKAKKDSAELHFVWGESSSWRYDEGHCVKFHPSTQIRSWEGEFEGESWSVLWKVADCVLMPGTF